MSLSLYAATMKNAMHAYKNKIIHWIFFPSLAMYIWPFLWIACSLPPSSQSQTADLRTSNDVSDCSKGTLSSGISGDVIHDVTCPPCLFSSQRCRPSWLVSFVDIPSKNRYSPTLVLLPDSLNFDLCLFLYIYIFYRMCQVRHDHTSQLSIVLAMWLG